MTSAFSYQEAFSRNIGWVTAVEQEKLRTKRVAIAGLGGVGGAHLLTLARLGIGAFNIADFDTFSVANFNRQAGAINSTIGAPKIEVLASMAREINPEINIREFPTGVDLANLEDFFKDVDIYVDGLDFFAIAARRATFLTCERMGIPAVTAAPLGMGAAVMCFMPGGMTFEEYFRLENVDDEEKAIRLLLGLAPMGLHGSYLVDPTAFNLQERRAPSTIIGCQVCAGVAAAEALKILLGRGKVRAAPRGYQFDAYRNKLTFTWRPGGSSNPLLGLARMILKRRISKFGSSPAK